VGSQLFKLLLSALLYIQQLQTNLSFLSVEDSRLAVESLQFLNNLYQRTLSTSYIMNPGIGSSIFLNKDLHGLQSFLKNLFLKIFPRFGFHSKN